MYWAEYVIRFYLMRDARLRKNGELTNDNDSHAACWELDYALLMMNWLSFVAFKMAKSTCCQNFCDQGNNFV